VQRTTHSGRTDEENENPDDVGVRNSTKPLGFGENELGGKGKEVVDHGAQECAYANCNSHQYVVHGVTIPRTPRKGDLSRRYSWSGVMMKTTVPPPTEQQLEAARRVIADHLVPTPTVTLSLRGRPVLTKMELFQPTGAFKIRGGLAAIDAALKSDPKGAVIASSAGNHGLGIAHAAMLLGARATVVVPETASAAKVKKLRSYDIELIQHGNSYDDAQAFALALAAERSIRFLSPFNDPDVVAGQSTVFDEMLQQAPELEHLVVSVGGGGLISGALVAREVHGRTDIQVTAVQPKNSSALYFALQGMTMAEVTHLPTIADGLAGGGDDGAMTNAIVAHHQIPFVLVPEEEIRFAVRECVEQNGLVMEGSATASYAAITNNLINDTSSRVGFIACGRNIAFDLLQSLLAD